MPILKLKIILSIFFCLITSHIFAEDLYVREFRDNSGRKIFYIDMVHIGTKEYFADVYKNIEKIFYSNKNVMILKEGIARCASEDSYYYNINLNSSYIPKIPLDYAIDYKDNNLSFIQDMIANDFLKKMNCNAKQNSSDLPKDLKPQHFSQFNDVIINQYPYLDEKILMIKENDNAKFSVLNDVFVDMSSVTVKADVIFSELPIFYKFLTDLSFMEDDLKRKFFSDEEIVELLELKTKVTDDFRDEQLLLNVFNTFYIKNTNTIILPWGSGHYPRLARKLEEKGFKEIEKQKLKYFECQTLKNEKVFDYISKECSELDILLQCGSVFDPKGEVLIRTEDKIEKKITTVTISHASLEWKYEYDAKTVSDGSNKLLNNKFYQDGIRQWSYQVGDKIYSYMSDKTGKIMMSVKLAR